MYDDEYTDREKQGESDRIARDYRAGRINNAQLLAAQSQYVRTYGNVADRAEQSRQDEYNRIARDYREGRINNAQLLAAQARLART
jgi:hypothetical protein